MFVLMVKSLMLASFSSPVAANSAKLLLLSRKDRGGKVTYNGHRFDASFLHVEYIPEWEDKKVGLIKNAGA